MSATPVSQSAATYINRGWSPIPIPAQGKRPFLPGWQHLRVTAEAVNRFFNGSPKNIGVLLGEPSAWLVDVDLDHELAVLEAENHLPATGAIFGRPSKPRSHWLYRVASPIETFKRQHKAAGMLVELRSTGCQTVFPPSLHPSGEPIEWHSDGEPLLIEPGELRACVDALADAVLDHLGIDTTAEPFPVPSASRPAPLDVTERAVRYLATIQPAVSGRGGHNKTWHASCALVLGFGLTPEQAYPLLAEFNQTCQPPWTEKELRHKLNDAHKQGGRRGYLLDDRGHAVASVAPRPAGAKPTGPQGIDTTDHDAAEKEVPRFAKLLTMTELFAMDLHADFLIDRVLVRGQPGVVGGRSKTLKTSLLVDLVASLGSGTPFLGQFQTQRARVAFWSGESGAATIRAKAAAVAKGRGFDLNETEIFLNFDLPKLARADDLLVLADLIADRGIEVAIIDPLYLSLLDASTAGQASNVFAMGAALQPLSELTSATGCTILLCHHFRKGGSDPDEPAALEELSQAGVGEWARQWLLLARRSAYQGDGRHELWLRAGGSAGHAGLYALDVDEGDPETFQTGGRRWEVSISSANDARQQAQQDAANRKAARLAEQDTEDRRRMLEALRRFPQGDTLRAIRDAAGLNNDRGAKAICTLIGEGRAEQVEITKNRRKETGYRPTGK